MREAFDEDDRFRRYDDDFDRSPKRRRRRRPHSGPGIASFVLAIAAGAVIFLTLIAPAFSKRNMAICPKTIRGS